MHYTLVILACGCLYGWTYQRLPNMCGHMKPRAASKFFRSLFGVWLVFFISSSYFFNLMCFVLRSLPPFNPVKLPLLKLYFATISSAAFYINTLSNARAPCNACRMEDKKYAHTHKRRVVARRKMLNVTKISTKYIVCLHYLVFSTCFRISMCIIRAALFSHSASTAFFSSLL